MTNNNIPNNSFSLFENAVANLEHSGFLETSNAFLNEWIIFKKLGVSVFACMCVHRVHARCLKSPEEAVRSQELEVTDRCNIVAGNQT